MITETVLFDIGGVLAPDYWEALWLTPGGLADRLGIVPRAAAEVVSKVWRDFDTVEAAEADYWRACETALGVVVPYSLVADAEKSLCANPFAAELANWLGSIGVRVGLVSNNTTFWEAKQRALPGFPAVDPELVLLSCSEGARKGGDPDLFVLAAGRCEPTTTLVIDDRPENLVRAKALGFVAVGYGDTRSPSPYVLPPQYAPFCLPLAKTVSDGNSLRIPVAGTRV